LKATTGTVVAVFGRRYEVRCDQHDTFDCVSRGKKRIATCGDRVTITITGTGQGVIEEILPRSSFLERSDQFKRKAIAANIDQVLILAAVEPRASEEFISRVLLIAHQAGIPAFIGLNKVDVPGLEDARARLAMFTLAGYDVIEMKAKPRDGTPGSAGNALHELLSGKTTVLVGQSGMGKSSLINALVPNAAAVIGELSIALSAGKHTTTFSRLYQIDESTALIDCPGMQEVGIHHLGFDDLQAGFVEFQPFLGHCRFYNCRHHREPGCAVKEAVGAGRIHGERLALFCRLLTETSA